MMTDTYKLEELANSQKMNEGGISEGGQRFELGNRKGASFAEMLRAFVEGTTAHGLPKVATAESRTRKAIWLVLFCAAFALFTYQCTKLVDQYLDYPIAVKMNVVTPQRMNFPAVTVCNLNMMRKDAIGGDPKYGALRSIDQFFAYKVASQSASKRTRRSPPAMGRSPSTRVAAGEQSFAVESADELRGQTVLRSPPNEKRQIQRNSSIFGISDHDPETLVGPKPGSGNSTFRSSHPFREMTIAPAGDRRIPTRKRGVPDRESGAPSWESVRQGRRFSDGRVLTENSRHKRNSDKSPKEYDPDYDWDEWEEDGSTERRKDEEDDADESSPSFDYPADDEEEFTYEDYGFVGKARSDYDFKRFIRLSKTSDYSDLVDVLKPSREDLDAYGHQASDFILQCSFDKKNCSHLDFRKVYSPTYGLCYVFNPETGNNTVRTTNKFGSRYGLRLTLDIEYDQYIGLFSHKAGARIAVHPNNITAFPEDFGVSASPGENTEIGVSLETISRQPPPYPSNCTDGSGYELLYEGNYTIEACSMTCLQKNLKERCGCTDRLVLSADESRCSVVNRTQEFCRQRVYYLFDKNQLGCDCPPPCLDHVYKTYTSSAEWPSTPYQYILAYELMKANEKHKQSDLLQRIRTTMLGIQVYLENPILVSIEEYPSYPWDRLLADIGGLLGLFIGVSACTVAELVELMADSSLLAVKLLLAKKTGKVRQQPHQRRPSVGGIKPCKTTTRTGHY